MDGKPKTQTWGASTASGQLDITWGWYGSTRRLSTLEAGKSGPGSNGALDLKWKYDDAGQITYLRDDENSAQVQCFTYNDLYQLTRAYTADNTIDGQGSEVCDDGYENHGTGTYDFEYTVSKTGLLQYVEDHKNSATFDYKYQETGNAGPHAVTKIDISGTTEDPTYSYDKNGNTTNRNGHSLDFDVNNRLIEYDNVTTTTEFTYDADGNRVTRLHGTTLTVYVGGVYEHTGTEHSNYYSFNGDLIGVRIQDTGASSDDLYWLLGDHLGSIGVEVDYNTGIVSRQWYHPYGTDRGTPTNGGVDETDRAYTGQIEDQTGLMFYNARYYDTTLRRFISADTIIPDPYNPQDLNRYSYVRNNPTNGNDPTGHCTQVGELGVFVAWIGYCPDAISKAIRNPGTAGKNVAKGFADAFLGVIDFVFDVADVFNGLKFLPSQDDWNVELSFGPDLGYEAFYNTGLGIGMVTQVSIASRSTAVFGPGTTRLSSAERLALRRADEILNSAEFTTIRRAHESGTYAEINVGGTSVAYEPGITMEGMAFLGEDAFVLGPRAFLSESELATTVLHESYRLATTNAAAEGLSQSLATSETSATDAFAREFFRLLLRGSG